MISWSSKTLNLTSEDSSLAGRDRAVETALALVAEAGLAEEREVEYRNSEADLADLA